MLHIYSTIPEVSKIPFNALIQHITNVINTQNVLNALEIFKTPQTCWKYPKNVVQCSTNVQNTPAMFRLSQAYFLNTSQIFEMPWIGLKYPKNVVNAKNESRQEQYIS